MVVTQYLQALEVILSLTIPLLVCVFALRRLVLSRSLNRVIYAIMASLAAATVGALIGTPVVPGFFQTAGPIYAFTCLALWLVVITLVPSTSGDHTYA